MSRIVINKKKVRVHIVIKGFLFIFCLIFIFTITFWFININLKLNILSNYIHSFSQKYDYLFKEAEISGLNNISEIFNMNV